ncbi:MAG: UDP-glucose/GDP-mannose dehydrogenase family protein [Chlamydiota bacterium]
MNILIIGCGYVGLVTGACLAKMGYSVTCIDQQKEKVALLQQGKIPIYEPGLAEIVAASSAEGLLRFSTAYPSLEEIDIAFLCVCTPQNRMGACDTSHLFSAAETLGGKLLGHTLVVNKSTAPVGTSSKICQILARTSPPESSFAFAVNPEFLKQGAAVQDCMKPDRIIIGTEDPAAKERLSRLYAPFMLNHNRMLFMTPASAELTKYAANAMLSARISFMNEMATIAECLGADIQDVRHGIGSDPRIGYDFLYPGLGYGGSCFPKDLEALQHMAQEANIDVPLLKAITQVNEKQKTRATRLLERYFAQGGLAGKVIALWGLSFKPDTDDIREAPSIAIIQELQKRGAKLQLFDPAAMEKMRKHLPTLENISFCTSPLTAAQGADAICLITEWKQFRSIDFSKIAQGEKSVLILDGRNQYNENDLLSKGFAYIGIGRPTKAFD